MSARPAASLITVSYRGDLALAQELCASVDRFVAPDFEHVLVVPRRDRALFAPLAGGSRRIVTVEDVLPRGFSKLPVPTRIALGPWRRRIREIWLTPAGIARGWIIQQIVKLSADKIAHSDVFVFADSDIVLVREVTAARFRDGDKVRLYHAPGATADSAMHRPWHQGSARLLGLPHQDYFGADYIGNLISWRRDALTKLQERLSEVAGKPWETVVASEQAFSEYVLYGIFAEHVLGSSSGHAPQTNDLVHASWHYPVESPEGRARFAAELGDDQIGVLIQSTTDFSLDDRRALIAHMTGS